MKVVITGGAGFIGCNLAARLSSDGYDVYIFDNLSRKGTEKNLHWLLSNFPSIRFTEGDIRDQGALHNLVESAELVCHLAAQVAVTTSVIDPVTDFEINARGTLNVLEAVRRSGNRPFVIFSSTNKVYGELEESTIVETENRYVLVDYPQGVPETKGLDFHSPYGCSKGTADQYVRDYCRIYGIPTVVFRQSCIYGPHQFGNEDQGWVAHFLISCYLGRPLTIYGNGKQVRDILYVDDLIQAYLNAYQSLERVSGHVYNIGGGIVNSISLLELLEILETKFPKKASIHYSGWRPGDQPVYISDIRKAQTEFGWTPLISNTEGIDKLSDWIEQNFNLNDR